MKIFLTSCAFLALLVGQFDTSQAFTSTTASCPTLDELAAHSEWVEHNQWSPRIDEVLKTYWTTPLDRAFPMVIPVRDRSGYALDYWFGMVSRSPITKITKQERKSKAGCHVVGAVAVYVDDWPPNVDIVKEAQNGREQDLFKNGTLRLNELRWFDPDEKRRHRWFNVQMADELDWLGSQSPNPLPSVINSLY